MPLSHSAPRRIAMAVVTGLFASSASAADAIMPAEQAIAVKDFYLFHQMLFAACGKETGDADTYAEVWQDWSRRNFYHLDVTDRVLAHHGVSYDPERSREANRTAIAMSLDSSGNAKAYCALAGLSVEKDTLNLPKQRPDLFDMLVVSDRVLRQQ